MKDIYNLKENLAWSREDGRWEYFEPMYNSRQSFYHKALIKHLASGAIVLASYSTVVAVITKEKKFLLNGIYSQTTTRHQKAFGKEFDCDYHSSEPLKNYVVDGFDEDKSQIHDYRTETRLFALLLCKAKGEKVDLKPLGILDNELFRNILFAFKVNDNLKIETLDDIRPHKDYVYINRLLKNEVKISRWSNGSIGQKEVDELQQEINLVKEFIEEMKQK